MKASEYRTRRIVEFADTDAAGILHFSNYFRYMEVAEHRFFRSLGLTVHGDVVDGKVVGFARGKAECNYRRPLKYSDEVELHVIVRAIMDKSITYEVVFHKVGHAGPGGAEHEPEEVARGRMTVVCVAPVEGGGLKAVPVPDDVRERLAVAAPEVGARPVPGSSGPSRGNRGASPAGRG